MANINNNPQTNVERGYNGFDMSKTVTFTSSVGQLLPVFSMLCSPNDKIRYGVDMFSRTQDLETAAFVRIKEHVDYFFVPLTQLFQSFDAIRYGIQDIKSSLYNLDEFGTNSRVPFFVYNDDLIISDSALGDWVNAYDFASLYDIGVLDEFYQPKVLNAARLFGLLGVDPTPLERLSLFVSDEDSEYVANQPNEVTASSNWMFGLDSTYHYQDTDRNSPLIPFNDNFNKMISGIPASSLLKFAAYQKIWFDCYRLTDYDVNDPSYYNLDQFYNNPAVTDGVVLAKFFKLRYRPWKKDLFTNIVPSPLFSGESINSIIGNTFGNRADVDINQWLVPTEIHALDNTGNTVDADSDSATSVSFADVNNLFLNTASIRSAFAVDRLMDVLRRTPKHYDKMTQAFFGIKPNYGLSGEVVHLGSDMSEINIDQVVSTADTEHSPLGAIGGKGYGLSKSQMNEFTAPCDGIFMAIYSAVPDADYLDTALERENTYLDMFDFYNPVMDELGMQPLFNYQLPIDKRYTDGAGFFGSIPGSQATNILGWQYRYSELKQKYDTVHGGFKYDMSHWVSVRNFIPEIGYDFTLSDMSERTADDYELKAITGVGYRFDKKQMYIDPSYLDNVMLVNDLPWSPAVARTPIVDFFKGVQDQETAFPDVQAFLFSFNRLKMSDLYQRDPLLHRFAFKVFKSSKMSTYGLPNF